MASGAPWTTRRKLFLVETLVFLVCMIGGIVFVLTGHGVSHALAGAVFLLLAIMIHAALRMTYFKQVLPEIKREREPSPD